MVCADEGENWLITQTTVRQWLLHIDIQKGSVNIWLTASFVCNICGPVCVSTGLLQCNVWTRVDIILQVKTKSQEFGDGFISVCIEQFCKPCEHVDWGEILMQTLTCCTLGVARLSFIYHRLICLFMLTTHNSATCFIVLFKAERFFWPDKVVSKSCLWALLMKSISPPFFTVHN